MWLIGTMGTWAIRWLMGVGVSEGRAGVIAASPAFGPIALLLVLLAGGGAAWGALKLHDVRVADRAVTVCVNENLIAGLKAESVAKAKALQERESRDEARAKELAAAEAAKRKLEADNEKLRKIAGAGGDRAVFGVDDCWLQRNCAGSGK